MSTRRQYLLVDKRKERRNSAPGSLLSASGARSRSYRDIYEGLMAIASISDVAIENRSGSRSSDEIDTSNLSCDSERVSQSGDVSRRESYQDSPHFNYEVYHHGKYDDKDSWRITLCSWTTWKIVLVAQLMAGCLTIMDVSTEAIRRWPQFYLANGQNFPNYFLLGMMWTSRLAWRNDGRGIVEVMKLSGLRYVLLAALHVEANYLLLSSFQHSSYMGNQMIDCVAASLSLVLAYVCLEVQFEWTHICGYAFAISGAIGLCAANVMYKKGDDDEVTWGDILRIVSGLFLAFNSLAQELIVKSIDSVEYLGMVGFIGTLICGIQSLTLESRRTIPQNANYLMSFCSFSVVQLIFSCLTPKLLREAGTTGFHLALISSGFYKYFFEAAAGRDKFQVLYFGSYTLVLLGSYIFTIKRTLIGKHYFYPIKVIISKET